MRKPEQQGTDYDLRETCASFSLFSAFISLNEKSYSEKSFYRLKFVRVKYCIILASGVMPTHCYITILAQANSTTSIYYITLYNIFMSLSYIFIYWIF